MTRALVARKRKIFALFFALAASIGLSWATTYVTITQNDFPSWDMSFTKDGVTVSAGGFIHGELGNIMDGGTFTTTLGNFTKIEVNAMEVSISGTGWSGNRERQTWTGNASSVSFSGEIMGNGEGVTIMCTIEEAAPAAYTVALQDGTANADKVTLSATSAVEGAIVIVTPNEGYEITDFSPYYVVVKGQVGSMHPIDATLTPETGAYSFAMPAANVTIEATIAEKAGGGSTAELSALNLNVGDVIHLGDKLTLSSGTVEISGGYQLFADGSPYTLARADIDASWNPIVSADGPYYVLLDNSGGQLLSRNYPVTANSDGIVITSVGSRPGIEKVYSIAVHDGSAAPAYETVMNLIDAIGEVAYTAECKAKIDEARAAYNALSDGDKDFVTNISTLTTAETAYKNLVLDAAQPAIAAIKAIPSPITSNLKLSAYEKVTAAREAYDALTDEEKAAIPEYLAILEEAEAAFAAIPSVGSETVITWDKNTGIENISGTTTSPAYEGITISIKGGGFGPENDMLRFNIAGLGLSFEFANTLGGNFQKIIISSTNAMPSTPLAGMGEGWAASNENKTATWTGDAATVKIWDGLTATSYWDVNTIQFTLGATVSATEAAQAAKDLIEAIGEVSYPASKEAIKAAREAVDALGANASLLDDADLQKLTQAEATYAELLAQAVKAVKDQIDALPATPLQDADKKLSEYNKVTDAREAYNALSDDAKAAVTNYDKLEEAEAAFAAISGGTKPVDIVWNKNTGIANVTPGSTSPAYEGMTVTTGSGSSFSQNSEGRMNFMFYSQNGGFTFANENGYNITKVVIESTTALTSTMTEVDRMGSGWAISNENKTATWTGDAATVKIWEGRTFTNYWYVDSIVFTVNGASSPLADAQAAKDLIDAIPAEITLDAACVNAIKDAREAVTALGENASLLDDADIDKLAKAEADFALLIKDATAVAGMIDAIGEVTFSADSKGKIVDAREAYEALSDELKSYVSNLDKLTAAEAAYDAARPFATVTTVPAAVEALQYTGAAQTLITAGAAEHGTVLYSLDGENYSAELPTALLPGAYTVYYKVQATDDYKDVVPVTVIATIAYNYPATYGLFGIPEGWSVKVNDEEVAVVNGAVKNIAANDRFDIMPVKPEDVKRVEIVPYLLDLATVTDSVIYILDGDSITGTANGHITVVIVPDAKVYFKDVNLTNTGSHPAVLCGGNAEIVVVGENTITCTKEGEYGIRAAGAGTTLTVSGDKTLLKATIDPNGGTVNQ